MFVYYGYAFPLSTRILRGFYRDGVWSDTGFMRWGQISAVSWKEEHDPVLILDLAGRAASPGGWRSPVIFTARPGGCFVTRSRPTTSTSAAPAWTSGSRERGRTRANSSAGRGHARTAYQLLTAQYGTSTDVERVPEGQSRQHPREGVSGDRVGRHASPSISSTPSARRASSRSAGARTASARSPTRSSSRATSSRRAATSSSTTRTSRRSASSPRASSTSSSSPTTPRSIRSTSIAPTTWRPTGAMAAEAFAVMREGMAGKAGIGKVALYGREYLVAVKPQKKGLVMYTLHHDAEIRSIDQIEELSSVPAKVKPEEMKLAKQVISTFDARAQSEGLQGRVQGRPATDHRRQDRRARRSSRRRCRSRRRSST